MSRIFVGNLPYDAREPELRRRFERYGRVASVRIVCDPGTNRSRGFAFVDMPSLDDADEAIERLAGISMGGRQLTINESKDDRRSPSRVPREKSARQSALEMFDALRGESPPLSLEGEQPSAKTPIPSPNVNGK